MCEQCKEKDEFDKKFEEELKKQSDPNCKICDGTGIIQRGWGKGFICGCVPEPDN